MTDMNPQAIRRFVEAFKQALIQFRRKHYELGGFLLRVKEETIYDSWPRLNAAHGERGYSSWEQFCEPETGYASRTCDQLIQNFRSLRELELDEEGLEFARCMRIGWSKLAVVLRYVGGPHNRFRDGRDQLEYALDGAERLSEPRLRSYLAEAMRDAALQQAQEQQRQTSARSGGESARPYPVPPEEMGDPDAPLTNSNPSGYVPYQLRFDTNESLDTFTRAVDIIRERYDGRLSTGRCASMMALHYLATHARDDEGGAVMDAENTIRLFEAALGIQLQVVQDEPTPRRRSTKKKASKKKASKKKVAKRRRQRSGETAG